MDADKYRSFMSKREDEPEQRPRLNLTTSQVAASALAACCASIVASYLGVAGTVIGAAIGSVVATIGAAVYAHLFRRGGDRIKQTLQVTTVVPEPRRGGRFYGAEAEVEAEPATERHWTPHTEPEPRDDRPGALAALRRHRRPIGVAAAIVAVFCVSISVGFLLGAPVRGAGASAEVPSTHTTTATVTRDARQGATGETRPQQRPSASADASSSPSASASASATASGSPSPSGSTSSTPAASPSVTPSQTSSP